MSWRELWVRALNVVRGWLSPPHMCEQCGSGCRRERLVCNKHRRCVIGNDACAAQPYAKSHKVWQCMECSWHSGLPAPVPVMELAGPYVEAATAPAPQVFVRSSGVQVLGPSEPVVCQPLEWVEWGRPLAGHWQYSLDPSTGFMRTGPWQVPETFATCELPAGGLKPPAGWQWRDGVYGLWDAEGVHIAEVRPWGVQVVTPAKHWYEYEKSILGGFGAGGYVTWVERPLDRFQRVQHLLTSEHPLPADACVDPHVVVFVSP